MTERGGVVIGVLASHDDRERAETLAEDLPHTLSERMGGYTDWSTEVCETEPADLSAVPSELTGSGATGATAPSL
jgi:hypothetical protein